MCFFFFLSEKIICEANMFSSEVFFLRDQIRIVGKIDCNRGILLASLVFE